jgi:uncharacterized protein
MHLQNSLSQKLALITGASSGIGELTSRLLAMKGLRVILVARREDKLQSIVSEINSLGGSAEYIVKDLIIEQERDSLFKFLSKSNSLPDILINNAGIGWYGYFYKMPWNAAKELLALNIEAVAHLTSLFLPAMLAKNYGHIINIGSVAGKLPEQGVAMYASSKAFLDSFTTILHRELRDTKVHVSVLRAGPIKTEFFEAARKMENGGNVPAEKLATSASTVAKGVWNLLRFPRKVVYIPTWMVFSPLLEILFEEVIDLVGPLLLRKHHDPKAPK